MDVYTFTAAAESLHGFHEERCGLSDFDDLT